jgi:gliding motility-associated-like protein
MTLIISDSFCVDTSFYHLPYKNKAIRLLSEAVVNKTCFPIHSGKITTTLEGGLPPYTYQWSHGATTANIENLMEGSYGLVARDQQGCVYAKNYIITTPAKIETTDTLYHLRCFGDSNGAIRIGVIGGIAPYDYLWSNSKTTQNIQNLNAGNYTIRIQDQLICIDSFSYVIREPQPIQIENMFLSHPICSDAYDGKIEVTAKGGTGALEYRLSPIQNTFGIGQRFTFLNPQLYNLSIRDQAGCQLDTSITLLEPQPKTLQIVPEKLEVFLGSKLEVSAASSPSNLIWKEIQWQPEHWFECSSCQKTHLQTSIQGDIILNAMDSNGCKYTATANVSIKDTNDLFIPNALSIHAKNESSYWKVFGKSIRQAEATIFNRWGEMVYNSNAAHIDSWDGRFKGEHVASGIYIYTCRIVLLNGMIKVFKGDLVVID